MLGGTEIYRARRQGLGVQLLRNRLVAGAAMILICVKCAARFGSAGELPAVCPACEQETTWTNAPTEPKVAWNVSAGDRCFMRSIRVSAE
jgi:hypothetical protein